MVRKIIGVMVTYDDGTTKEYKGTGTARYGNVQRFGVEPMYMLDVSLRPEDQSGVRAEG